MPQKYIFFLHPALYGSQPPGATEVEAGVGGRLFKTICTCTSTHQENYPSSYVPIWVYICTAPSLICEPVCPFIPFITLMSSDPSPLQIIPIQNLFPEKIPMQTNFLLVFGWVLPITFSVAYLESCKMCTAPSLSSVLPKVQIIASIIVDNSAVSSVHSFAPMYARESSSIITEPKLSSTSPIECVANPQLEYV